MAFREIAKNSREYVRVRANRYMGHDLVDIRVFAVGKENKDHQIPTKSGVSINADLVPDLIDALLWSLNQPCDEDDNLPTSPELSPEDVEVLGQHTYGILKAHGSAVHWDSIEKLSLSDKQMSRFTKWNLHYVLVVRRDLFFHAGSGCFKAR